MSIESRSRQYGKVFDHWQIKEFLGSGSGGKTAVFRLVRSDSTRGVSALKVVNLIEVRGDINNLSEFRRKEYETARDECSQNAEQEVWLMDELRGNTNIVDYLDHTFVDWSDETGFGRDLLIRMELLKDLRSELQNGRIFSEMEALKIGRDICIALVRCHRKNILHRDVKPENIFRNKDGDYKLGDFGVSRVLDACPGAVASTGIGTYEYWPAEQMTGRYDKRVDIYSLGLVLYELCNQNHLPFAVSTYATSKEVSMRLAGTPLPEPSDASPALATVILKACAFDPDERYQSAGELLKALNRVIRSLQGSVEQKAVVIPQEKAQQNTEYATLPAEVSNTETSTNDYKTMPADADGQRKKSSFSIEPAKKKPYATDPAEKYVPRYATQAPVHKKKNKIPKAWTALALFGLCMVVFSVGFLFVDVLDKRNPVEKDTILQSEITVETVDTTVESTAESTEINSNVSESTNIPPETTETTTPVVEITEPMAYDAGNTENDSATQKRTLGIISNTDMGVNIRSGPNMNDDFLGKYLPGTTIEILNFMSVDGKEWCRTEHGWVSMDYVTIMSNTEESASSNSAGEYRYMGTVINTTAANIRANPSTSSSVVTSLSKNEKILIYETTVSENMAWGRCDQGWVYLYYIDLSPFDLTYIDARVIGNDNAIVYADTNCSAVAGTYSRMSVVDIYEIYGDMARTDLGWVKTYNFL